MASFLLAWRNLLRNKRRSALTISSIAVGLAAVMFGQSLLKSFQRQMIEKSTGAMLGHIQVQARGAEDRKVPDQLLGSPEKYKQLLTADPRVDKAASRLLFTGLVSSPMGSRGVAIVGVEADLEPGISIMPGYLTEGRYLGDSPRDIFIGAKVARELDLRLGERVVVMGQNLEEEEMSSELFRVAGLFKSGSVAYDGQIVYISLAGAQRLRGRPGMVSHVVARLKSIGEIDRFVAERKEEAAFSGDAILLSYKDVGSEISGIKKFQDALLVVILIVIFSIVGLGITNTISMSFFERIREFGVLRAVGARRVVIGQLLFAEAALMGVIGAAGGLLLGISVIVFFGARGLELPLGKAMAYFIPFENVIYMRPMWHMHLWSAVAVIGVCLVTAIGPIFRATRLVIAAALRHV